MWRSNIPVSITLAQALLESAAGQSELALQANNHFGIKCGSGWDGSTYYKINSGAGADGKLDTSCYRAYPSIADSYGDREFFLARSRYESLFRLNPDDYVGWAYGLLYCGYAESPNYPVLLIGLIERYSLNRYDTATALEAPARLAAPSVASIRHEPPATLPPDSYSATPRAIFTIASGGETVKDIARRTGAPLGGQLVYNEDLPAGYVLPQRQAVYLDYNHQEKPIVFILHLFQPGESMASIAQLYHVSLERLLALNLMQPSDELKPGTLLVVKGNPALYPPDLNLSAPATSTESEVRSAHFHTVISGDTMWGIARRYSTTVETIKALNDLQSELIGIGIVLRVR